MITIVVREDTQATEVVAFWHVGELPAYRSLRFSSFDAVKAMYPLYDWQEPDADADADVIAWAQID